MPQPDFLPHLVESFRAKTARIGVVGLGYVGIPLAGAFVSAGFRVLGFDVDPHKIALLRAGRSYLKHYDSETIGTWVRSGALDPTDDLRRLGEPDAVLICVPTPLDEARDPDLSYVEGTARSIAAVLRPGQLVVLESTTYPTTTRNVVRPILESRGLVAGRDFLLAYSPEREDPGNPDHSAPRIPKVVGGLDDAALAAAVALYEQAVVRIVPVSSPEVAEACKILENTYRAVNIALVNELKVLFDRMGIDVWEVIEAARTKPFGFQAFTPGPGLGGHCIPIDPFYLSWKAKQNGFECRFIELAGQVNASMPGFAVERIADALNSVKKAVNGSRVHLFGVAYKKDVSDLRESPALDILELLARRGAIVSYTDPYVPHLAHGPHTLDSVPECEALSGGYDCLVITTDHSSFNYAEIARVGPLIVDTRNALKAYAGPIFRL
jgi:UDP-N-acetyl-D-glucosamine dehydrogenase